MSELLYEKMQNRIITIHEIYIEYSAGKENKMGFSNIEKYGIGVCDPAKYTIEFIQFKKEYPDDYKGYLNRFLIQYELIYHCFDKIERCTKVRSSDITVLLFCMEKIIGHLRGMLNTENDIQEPPKPIATPKGQTVLNQKQSNLLYWYLRENKMISQKVQNQHLAAAINILTGYESDQNQEILRTKGTNVFQLGKGNDKVTRSDLKTVMGELQKLIEKIKTDAATKTGNNK